MTILLDSPAFPPAAVRPAPPVFIPAPREPPADPGSTVGAAATRRVPTTAVVPVAVAAGTGDAAGIAPVTTLAQAVRIALDRTRRMTLLGSVPGVRRMVLPWLMPLHLMIVGLTADHIRHTPDASLSYSDGTTPRPHRGALALALLLGLGWSAVLVGVVWALSWRDLTTAAVVVLAAALVVPVVELLGLFEFAVLNPEWVTLKRRNRRTDRRTAYVLTSLVSRRDGCGAARRLMDLTYPQWQAVDAVVIGYPASKSLISYYVRMGARRCTTAAAGERPAGRSVTFDCRRPLRVR